MKTAKEEAYDLLGRLPDDVSMDALLTEMHFVAGLQRARDDVRRGDVFTQEEVRQRLNKWLASSGRTKLSGT